MTQTPPPDARVDAPTASWPPGGSGAPDPVTRWLTSLTRGLDTAAVVRAGVESLVVVGGTLVLLTVLLGPALASVGDDDVRLGAGSVFRVAAVLLGMAAFGRLSLTGEVTDGSDALAVTATTAAAPLTVTALLVVGFALAARLRPPAGFRRHVQSSALVGVAAGVLLAVVSAVATTDRAPFLGEVDWLEPFRYRVGVGPWRVLVTGGLLATASSFVPLVLSHARAGWGGERSRTWLTAASAALRLALVAAAAAAVAALVLVAAAVRDGGPLDLPDLGPVSDGGGAAAWVLVLAFLPNVAGALVGLATGTSFVASVLVPEETASVLDLGSGSDSASSSAGLLGETGSGWLWLALPAALVVLALVAARGALLRDPRVGLPGHWWRTGTVFAVLAGVAGVAAVATGASASLSLTARGDLSGLGIDSFDGRLDAAVARAGLSLAGAVPLAFGLGALTAVVQQRATRPLAGALPGVVAAARRLPGGVHPLWSLLLVDASTRLGRRPSAALLEPARLTQADAEGLRPLDVDPVRSKVALTVLAAVGVLLVLVPVVLAVLSTTVFGPGAAARGYAAALRTGDAAALREAAGEEETPALSAAALAVQRSAAPITDVRTTVDTADGFASATVSYRVDGEEHAQAVALEKSSDRAWGLLPRWTASASLPDVVVSAPSGLSGFVINGQSMGAAALADTGGTVTVFPGHVKVSPSVGPLLTGTSWEGVSAGDVPAAEAGFSYDLKPASREQAEAAVAAWLDRCEASTDTEPDGCPLSGSYLYGDEQDDVRWSYSAPEDVTVSSTSDGSVVTAEGSVDGEVSYDYSYDGYLASDGTSRTTETESGLFSGRVTFGAGGATFTPDGEG